MKYLELIYKIDTGVPVTAKIHGIMSIVVPSDCNRIILPYVKGMRKNLDMKIFDGEKLIINPNYIKPLSIDEQIDTCSTIKDIKEFLKSILIYNEI